MRRIGTVVATSLLVLVTSTPGRADASPPRFPGPPTVSELTLNSALLTWQPPDTDPAPAYYDIYRIVDGQEHTYNGSYTTSLRLASLAPNTSYTFVIGVRPQAGHNGLRSPAVTFRTPSAPVESNPPTAPGTPVVTDVAPGRLTLTWAASLDDSGIDRYLVYLSGFGQTVLHSVTVVYPGNPGTTWTDTRTLPDYDYEFHLVAVDHAGNRSAPSAPVNVRTPPLPGGSCRAAVQITQAGGGRHSAVLTIVNTGGSVDVHTIRATLPPGQHNDPMASWNFVQLGNELVYAYSGWSGGFPSGGRKQLPFVIRYDGAPVPPTGWRLNGQLCTAL
ncbi:hypothetical protein GCM10009557_43910 [Virgisporangium ochraceum]